MVDSIVAEENRMKLISSVIVAVTGAAILVAGSYNPHGDTAAIISMIGGTVGILGLGFWVRGMLSHDNS